MDKNTFLALCDRAVAGCGCDRAAFVAQCVNDMETCFRTSKRSDSCCRTSKRPDSCCRTVDWSQDTGWKDGVPIVGCMEASGRVVASPGRMRRRLTKWRCRKFLDSGEDGDPARP